MKNLLNSLKSLNYKEFGIQHGEKIALSVVGLIVLLTLALGTQWSRYNEIAPDELEKQVSEKGQTIRTAAWPETEKAALEATLTGPAHPQRRVSEMLEPEPLGAPGFGFTMGPVIWEPLPRRVPIREPNWYRLVDPIASHGRIILDVPQRTEMAGGVDPMDAAVGDGVDGRRGDENAFVARKQSKFDPRQAAAAVGEGVDPGAGLGMRLEGFAPPGAGPMDDEGDEFAVEDSGPSSGLATHYVSVRMLFPARAQLQSILNARGIGAVATGELLSIQDFEIQRSQAITSPDGKTEWTKWKEFDLEKTLQLLDLVASFDSESLHPQVIDPTITMPLPMPKYGYWEDAGHPKLERYRLSAQQQQQFDIVANAIAQTRQQFAEPNRFEFGAPGAGAFGEDEAGDATPEKGGWATKVLNFREEMSNVASNQEAARATFDAIKTQTQGQGMEALNFQALSATGEYLLFRFVDFDVEPGRAYRYRARLKLLNPNFGLPIDRVLRPEVAEGQFRPDPENENEMERAWSEATNAVVVPDDLEYYVAGVRRSTTAEPQARMRVHVWSDVLGTWVSNVVDVAAGERVGGSQAKDTAVADLVKDSFEERQPVRFEAEDVLADLVATPVIDLKDATHAKYLSGIDAPRIDVLAPVVVLNEFGELVERDPGAESDRSTAAQRRYDEQMEALEPLLSTPADPSALDGEGGLGSDEGISEFYGGEDDEGGTTAKPRRRSSRRAKKGNPLRIGGS